MSVRTRFAPSPTGYLHIGGVRTAYFNYLLAKQHGGQFILRIDDTDQERNVAEALQPILEGFRWLGLQWDEGPEVEGPYAPYYQSQRLPGYQAAVKKLLERGFAYRDYARTEELALLREEADKAGKTFVYDRRWMAETDQQAAAFEAEGRSAVIRLKMPRKGTCSFHDLIRGDVEFEWANEQDHVVQRTDGTCLYHLASVVDDFDFRITHVVRAVEHLPNTPRQIFIAQSLDYPLPIYAHLPYVAEPGGTAKLSKRKLDKYLKQKDFAALNAQGEQIARQLKLEFSSATFNPVVVDFYREIGFLPEAILNYLLLVGWSLDDSTEHFSKLDALKHFSLDRVNKSPASFDPQKLVSFQSRWMNLLPIDEKVKLVMPYLTQVGWDQSPWLQSQPDYLTRILQAAGDRLKVAGDVLQFDEFFAPDDQLTYDPATWEKRVNQDPAAVGWLAELDEIFSKVERYQASDLEQAVKDWLALHNRKLGQLIPILRLATTGKPVGIGLFETLEILGRDRVHVRMQATLQAAAAALPKP